jgi:holo-[acyl-carrier protein] synthase
MRHRVGIDLVSVEAVEDSIAAHGARYLARVYTPAELDDSRDERGEPVAQRLAARFAAKEAMRKALHVGDEAVPWQSIAVRRDRCGAPRLELTGRARELAEREGIRDIDVSLSHEGATAAAVVVAEVGPR